MPAHEFEVEEAEEEGVMMKWLSTIKQADQGRLVLEKMELDDTGFPQPTGNLEELEADSIVLALGQEADLSLLDGVPGLEAEDGVVKVGPNLMTGHAGIFAGGDMVPAERTVTVGIGHGKKAAGCIDVWLRGGEYEPPPEPELATSDKLNTWYYADAPRTHRPQLELARRSSTFEEVKHPLDQSNALYEARRCLSCGNCFSCDNCYGVCPDNAVLKLSDTRSTSTSAKGAECASRSVRRGQSRWSRKRSEHARAERVELLQESGSGLKEPDVLMWKRYGSGKLQQTEQLTGHIARQGGWGDGRPQTAAGARALQARGRPFEPGTAPPQGSASEAYCAVALAGDRS
jgi:ferredoxin